MDLLSYGSTFALICLAPGPIMATLILRGLAGQVRAGAAFTAGLVSGDLLALVAVALGLGWWLGGFQAFQIAAKALGVSYLAWVAFGLWRRPKEEVLQARRSVVRGDLFEFAAGLAVNMSSPFTIFFFLSLLSAMAESSETIQSHLRWLAALTALVSTSIHLGFVILAGRFQRFLVEPALERWTRQVLATLLGVAALWLLVS